MENNCNFILTMDKNTALKLKKQGFKQIKENDREYLFLNCKEKMSMDIDKTKIAYTNSMNF